LNEQADVSYFDEIKKPMDLGTISKKIETKRYRHMEALADDIELVVNK
jgi:transcription initiation factor TFIID subunit 2